MPNEDLGYKPEEFDQLIKIMNIKYAPFLKDRSFSYKVEIKPDNVCMQVILSNAKETYYYPVEAIFYKEQLSKDLQNSLLQAYDYIDFYFNEFLESNEEVMLPIDWKEQQYEGVRFGIRGQVLNRFQEQQADKLLGIN